jgi:hypothetical protein
MKSRGCKTCDGAHDAALHAARLSIRRWLRSRIAPPVIARPTPKRA